MTSLLPAFVIFLTLAFASARQVRVSCIGDSITQGACCTGSYCPNYPAKLQELLGDNYLVGNYGNSGKTLLYHGLCEDGTSCAYTDTPTWPAALASTPDIVTIMMGTNDAKNFNWFGVQDNRPDSFGLDYLKMIRSLRQLSPRPQIFIMTPVPLYDPAPFDMNSTIVNSFMVQGGGDGLIWQIASIADVQVIDIHTAFNGYNASITCDNCHPTDEGFDVIAKTMAPVIQKASVDMIQRNKYSVV